MDTYKSKVLGSKHSGHEPYNIYVPLQFISGNKPYNLTKSGDLMKWHMKYLTQGRLSRNGSYYQIIKIPDKNNASLSALNLKCCDQFLFNAGPMVIDFTI